MVPVPPFFLAVPVLGWAPRHAVSSSESWVVPWTPTGLSGPIPPPSLRILLSGTPAPSLRACPVPIGSSGVSLVSPGWEAAHAGRPTPRFLSTLADKRTLREPRGTDGGVQRYLFFRPHFGGRIKPFAGALLPPGTSQRTEPPVLSPCLTSQQPRTGVFGEKPWGPGSEYLSQCTRP